MTGYGSFLTVEVGYYLPPYETINIYFMKELLAKKKRHIKGDQVKYLYVP